MTERQADSYKNLAGRTHELPSILSSWKVLFCLVNGSPIKFFTCKSQFIIVNNMFVRCTGMWDNGTLNRQSNAPTVCSAVDACPTVDTKAEQNSVQHTKRG